MKVFYEKIIPTENQSFSCNEGFDFSQVPYHHHAEIEITYIDKGTGQRCIGNHIDTFYPGDLVICGSMLPHVWIPSKNSIEKKQQHSFVLQFSPQLFGESFWQSKELQQFGQLLQQAKQGLHCPDPNERMVKHKFKKILNSKGITSLMALLDLWHFLEDLPWSDALSPFYDTKTNYNHIPIIEKVVQYLLHHYQLDIRQPELADMVSMSSSHFSRFFKKSTGHSFSDYLNKIRIDQACQRIQNTDLSISQIAYDVGYRNLSQFNLNFKKIYNITPKAYQLKCRKEIG